MSSPSTQATVTINDIADHIDLTRPRVSQIRKTDPTFPKPVTGWTTRPARFDEAQIKQWAEQAGYTYRTDDTEAAAREAVHAFWVDAPAGHYELTSIDSLRGTPIHVYQDGTESVAVLFQNNYGFSKQQIDAYLKRSGVDWVVIVLGQWTMHGPFVEVASQTTGILDPSLSLTHIAKRLGATLPLMYGRPSIDGMWLSYLSGTPLSVVPDDPMTDLLPAYRLLTMHPDVDVRATAAELVERVQKGADPTPDTWKDIDRLDRDMPGILRRGTTTRTELVETPSGDPDTGFRKMMTAPPDDDIIQTIEILSIHGGPDEEYSTINPDSDVTATYIRTTWNRLHAPLSGHAYLLRHFYGVSPDELEYYRNPASDELAIIHDKNVAMTRRHDLPDRSPAYVVLAENEGAIYLDADRIAYAPAYHQGIGYGSGNRTIGLFVASELGVARPTGAHGLTRALNTGSIELNTPIPVSEILPLLRPDAD